jgi:hypothetical protein
MTLEATFRHVGRPGPAVLRIVGSDADAILRLWQARMEAFVQEGFPTLTCVCRWL